MYVEPVNRPILTFMLKVARKLYHIRHPEYITEAYCEAMNQDGNDLILEMLNRKGTSGFMLSKWGTTEFDQALRSYLCRNKAGWRLYMSMIRGDVPIPERAANRWLYTLSGVFPLSAETADRFGMQALEDCQMIDILASYIPNEQYLAHYWSGAVKVNLDAFYAPWLFRNPWTKWLKGKRVVVVHPFVESIRHQYENNRERLFTNPEVLPEFKELICIKAVQTLAGEPSQFRDWFEALHYMEDEIDRCEYDAAIIGCGAYGMSLAAHVKRRGKVAIHLAGWTQMLFGVYGERWVSQQPKYSSVINEYWIRPNNNERIKNGSKVDNGCYW